MSEEVMRTFGFALYPSTKERMEKTKLQEGKSYDQLLNVLLNHYERKVSHAQNTYQKQQRTIH